MNINGIDDWYYEERSNNVTARWFEINRVENSL